MKDGKMQLISEYEGRKICSLCMKYIYKFVQCTPIEMPSLLMFDKSVDYFKINELSTALAVYIKQSSLNNRQRLKGQNRAPMREISTADHWARLSANRAKAG
jgi:hypothetical protein